MKNKKERFPGRLLNVLIVFLAMVFLMTLGTAFKELREARSGYSDKEEYLMMDLQDSLAYYAPPERRGAIGFNIAGAFLMIPAVAGVVMMVLGLVIAVVFYYLWERERKRRRIDSV